MHWFRYLSLALFAGAIGLSLAGCPARTRAGKTATYPAKTTSPLGQDAKLRWKKYHFTFTEKGQPVWSAEIQSGETDLKTGIMTLHGITSRMYRQGREALQITAENGKAAKDKDAEKFRVSLAGKVEVFEPQRKLRLTADTFRWVSGTDTITATNIYWRGMGMEQWADRGSFTTDLTQASVQGNVRAEYTPSGK